MSNGSSVRNSAKGKSSNPKNAKGPNIPKLPIVMIGVGFAALFAAVVAYTSLRPPSPAASAIGGPFQLTAQNGQTVTDKELLGRPFLVFFGYTHCPDICHTTLFEMSEVLRALGPQAKIGALFVTVDPERDTPAVLKDYLANFDPRIIGLSGDHARARSNVERISDLRKTRSRRRRGLFGRSYDRCLSHGQERSIRQSIQCGATSRRCGARVGALSVTTPQRVIWNCSQKFFRSTYFSLSRLTRHMR